MRALQALGFRVPDWVVTNVPEIATSFVDSHRDGCVIKSASGLRSHVRRWTSRTRDAFLNGTAPHVIQTMIRGGDVRIHVVGSRIFATQIQSDATDYRFDSAETAYNTADVPTQVADLCLQAARQSGLLLAGLDFRVDSDDGWWCLEMNPVPTFLPYESGTGQCIGDAVIDLLVPKSTKVMSALSPLFPFTR